MEEFVKESKAKGHCAEEALRQVSMKSPRKTKEKVDESEAQLQRLFSNTKLIDAAIAWGSAHIGVGERAGGLYVIASF